MPEDSAERAPLKTADTPLTAAIDVSVPACHKLMTVPDPVATEFATMAPTEFVNPVNSPLTTKDAAVHVCVEFIEPAFTLLVQFNADVVNKFVTVWVAHVVLKNVVVLFPVVINSE